MTRTTLSLITAGLLATTGTAFADGDDGSVAPAPPADPVAAPAAAPASGGLDGASLVTPTGKLEVHGTLPIFKSSITTIDPTTLMPTTVSQTFVGLAVGATYGVIDKLEVGGEYGHNLSPSDGNGAINAHAAYLALHSDKLDLALAADIALPLDSGATDTLSIGAWARYHVAPKISVFTGNPGLPHTTGLGGAFLSLGQYQLAFGLNNGNHAGLTVPVGVGIQATPQLYAFVSTTVASIALSGGGSNAFIFSDTIPLEVGAYFSVNDKLDVGAEFSDDLKFSGDFYNITFNARYWVK